MLLLRCPTLSDVRQTDRQPTWIDNASLDIVITVIVISSNKKKIVCSFLVSLCVVFQLKHVDKRLYVVVSSCCVIVTSSGTVLNYCLPLRHVDNGSCLIRGEILHDLIYKITIADNYYVEDQKVQANLPLKRVKYKIYIYLRQLNKCS